MARTIVIGSGTGDVQAFTGETRLYGFTVQATVAPATVVLRDGTADTAPPVAFFEAATVSNQTVQLPRTHIAAGLFVDRQAGTSRVTLYIS